MFANCQLGGMNFGFPDVCLTPIVVPVPVPYPNLAMGMTANPATACKKIYLSCMPAHNIMTQVPISQGDNAGVNMGVASGMVMGPSRHLMGSFGVIYEGSPVTKMTSLTGQNGMSLNTPGMTLVPAQFKVMIMK
ncbi:MAG: DUF4150 domain-containing protein [Deltaproteobacteria bacterium]|nr:MAG: DUF4150 domain-containing protein [Deltaproteobacteria bacterium]